jgi:hypothetical protein
MMRKRWRFPAASSSGAATIVPERKQGDAICWNRGETNQDRITDTA